MCRKISVVINTYNATRHLDKVLDSVKNFDEIVVCDMESTDNTCDIARRYGCRIVNFPKGEHRICEPARDFAIHSATNKWVFVVDADEIVPDTLRSYLYEKISDSQFDGALAVSRINSFMGDYAKGTPDYQLRFFQKDRAVWPAVIHSRPAIDGKVYNIPARKELSLWHLDDPNMSKRIEKLNVYSDYEVPKRSNKKYGIGKLLFRPWWFFIKNYIIGGGFKDGKRGVIRSYMAMIYQIMLLSKVIEYQSRPIEDERSC